MNEPMPDILAELDALSRRRFLGALSMGIGAASLSQWPGGPSAVAAGSHLRR